MKKETVILDKDKSFMTVRHLVLEGSNYEIGHTLGEIAIERHQFCVEKTVVAPEMRNARYNYYAQHYPLLLQRTQGVADALGVGIDDDQYDTSAISFNQDMPGPMCSGVYYPPETTATSTGILSRNYDFPTGSLADLMSMGVQLPPEVRESLSPMMGDPYIIEMYPDEGHSSLCLTSFELLSGVLDGINSEGLIVSVNGDETATGPPLEDREQVGLHELQSMRLLLDTCATTQEAKKVLLENDHFHAFMPCHYMIADETSSFVFEHAHRYTSAHIVEGEGPQVITNHPLYKYPTVDDFPEITDPLKIGTTSFDRFKTLSQIIEKENPPYTVDFMKKANRDVSVSQVVSWIPQEYRLQFVESPGLSRTLWHCLYDSKDRTLQIKFYLQDNPTEKDNFTEQYTDYFQFGLED